MDAYFCNSHAPWQHGYVHGTSEEEAMTRIPTSITLVDRSRMPI
jgi:hypothetical protein